MVYFAGNEVAAIQSTIDPLTKEPKLAPVTAAGVAVAAIAPAPNVPALVALIFLQLVFVTMVYAPIAAYLVEAFPARIRYTSLSLPYHIGNGVFGGLLPTIGLLACAYTGNIYAGLWYPMIIASITFIVGMRYLPETHKHKIWDEVEPNK
jgi:MFS family permease